MLFKEKKMIIITGCGRSGTQYMWRVLRDLGFDVGHEEWGKDGQVGFHAAVNLRGAALNRPWREVQDPENDVVLQQVREPLGTISSVQTFQDYSWDFICEHSAVDRHAPLVVRCMQYWYFWNLMAERWASFIYQIERLETAWPTICENIGIDRSTPLPEETRKDRHFRTHTNLTWQDLSIADPGLTEDIRILAEHYGYEDLSG